MILFIMPLVCKALWSAHVVFKVLCVRALVENIQTLAKIISRLVRSDSFEVMMSMYCAVGLSPEANLHTEAPVLAV